MLIGRDTEVPYRDPERRKLVMREAQARLRARRHAAKLGIPIDPENAKRRNTASVTALLHAAEIEAQRVLDPVMLKAMRTALNRAVNIIVDR